MDGIFTVTDDKGAHKPYPAKGTFGLISKKPCLRCNNGWMSRLETSAKPVLLPLLNGEKCLITPDKQCIIARWFMKIIFLYELTYQRASYFFNDSERHDLMDSIVPATSLFFLARYGGDYPVLTREMFDATSFIDHLASGQRIPVRAYVATLAVKQLALQVYADRRPKEHQRLRVITPEPWRDAIVQIWPIIEVPRWPPPVVLDDEGFNQFAHRFPNSS